MSNSYYNQSGAPSQGSAGSSAVMRAEFAQIVAGFDKLPALGGNANHVALVNAGATGLTTTSAIQVSGGNVAMSGNLTVAGSITGSISGFLPLTGGTLAGPGNLAVGGTLSVAGISSFAAGSVGAPSISRTGDSGTGLWFPAASTVALSVGGVEAWRTASTGVTTFTRTVYNAASGPAAFNTYSIGGTPYGYFGDRSGVLGSGAGLSLRSEGDLYLAAQGAGVKLQLGASSHQFTGQLGVNMAPSSVFQVQTLNEAGGGSNQGVGIIGAGGTRQLNLGVNTTSGVPWIQAWQPGVGAANISLNPSGGAVGIGGTPATLLNLFENTPVLRFSQSTPNSFTGLEFFSGAVTGSVKFNSNSGELRVEAGFGGFGGFTTFYTNGVSRAEISSSGVFTYGGLEVGYRNFAAASVTSGAFVAADNGKTVYATGGVTIPNGVMVATNVVGILNATGSTQTITKSVTTAYDGSTGSALGATFNLPARRMITVVFTAGNECYVYGL